jgi:hypothetical protein
MMPGGGTNTFADAQSRANEAMAEAKARLASIAEGTLSYQKNVLLAKSAVDMLALAEMRLSRIFEGRVMTLYQLNTQSKLYARQAEASQRAAVMYGQQVKNIDRALVEVARMKKTLPRELAANLAAAAAQDAAAAQGAGAPAEAPKEKTSSAFGTVTSTRRVRAGRFVGPGIFGANDPLANKLNKGTISNKDLRNLVAVYAQNPVMPRVPLQFRRQRQMDSYANLPYTVFGQMSRARQDLVRQLIDMGVLAVAYQDKVITEVRKTGTAQKKAQAKYEQTAKKTANTQKSVFGAFDASCIKAAYGAGQCDDYVKDTLRAQGLITNRLAGLPKVNKGGIRPGDIIHLRPAGGRTTQHWARVAADGIHLDEAVLGKVMHTRTLAGVMHRIDSVRRANVPAIDLSGAGYAPAGAAGASTGLLAAQYQQSAEKFILELSRDELDLHNKRIEAVNAMQNMIEQAKTFWGKSVDTYAAEGHLPVAYAQDRYELGLYNKNVAFERDITRPLAVVDNAIERFGYMLSTFGAGTVKFADLVKNVTEKQRLLNASLEDAKGKYAATEKDLKLLRMLRNQATFGMVHDTNPYTADGKLKSTFGRKISVGELGKQMGAFAGDYALSHEAELAKIDPDNRTKYIWERMLDYFAPMLEELVGGPENLAAITSMMGGVDPTKITDKGFIDALLSSKEGINKESLDRIQSITQMLERLPYELYHGMHTIIESEQSAREREAGVRNAEEERGEAESAYQITLTGQKPDETKHGRDVLIAQRKRIEAQREDAQTTLAQHMANAVMQMFAGLPVSLETTGAITQSQEKIAQLNGQIANVSGQIVTFATREQELAEELTSCQMDYINAYRIAGRRMNTLSAKNEADMGLISANKNYLERERGRYMDQWTAASRILDYLTLTGASETPQAVVANAAKSESALALSILTDKIGDLAVAEEHMARSRDLSESMMDSFIGMMSGKTDFSEGMGEMGGRIASLAAERMAQRFIGDTFKEIADALLLTPGDAAIIDNTRQAAETLRLMLMHQIKPDSVIIGKDGLPTEKNPKNTDGDMTSIMGFRFNKKDAGNVSRGIGAAFGAYGIYSAAQRSQTPPLMAAISGAVQGAELGTMAFGAAAGPWGAIIGLGLALLGVNSRQKEVVEKIFDTMPKRTDMQWAAPSYLPFSAYAGGRAGTITVNVTAAGSSTAIGEAVKRDIESAVARGITGRTAYVGV